MMYKTFAPVLLLLLSGVVLAESSPAKKDLVARVLVLQQGAIEQTGQSLAERPALQLMQQAGLALQTRVAPEKREAVAKLIQAEAKKYADEAGPLVRQQAVKLAPATIGSLLDEKFTEEELTQLIAIMESPVNRKYSQMGGEFQKALGDKLVAQTRSVIEPKIRALEQALAKHLGLPLASAAKASEPASKVLKK